jgi:aspartate/methionine/tyrosine aminotransferase
LALALVDPGDVVLVPDPGYPIYAASVELAGGTLVTMPLRAENGFLPDFEAIPAEVAARAKFMILNFPGNPVATLVSADFFEQAIAFAKRHNILIVHDFAYSELVFDGHRAVSLLSVPGAKDVAIEFNSLSKTFNLAGCRIGYVVGNAAALHWLELLKSHVDYGIFAPIQEAAIAALTSPPDALTAQVHVYERRRDVLVDGLRAAGWPVPTVHATMFLWARIPEGFPSSKAFARTLLEETGVVVTPGDAFGREGEGYVRIALVQPEAALAEACRRIGQFLQTARG